MSFEVFLRQTDGPSLKRRLIYVLSISLHLALVFAAGVHSFWHVEEISPRGVSVTFMSGLAAPPAPPPPPAPAAKPVTPSRIKPRVPQVERAKPQEVAQPQEPVGVAEQASGEEGEPESVAAGIQGGGVAGVAAALPAPELPAAPPPQRIVEVAPILLPPSVGTSHRISDVNDPEFRPTLPPALNRAGVTVRGLLRICVSTEGKVTEVKFLRSGDPLVDAGWTAVIRRWQYKPLITNGRATPFCHPLMLEVRALG